MRFPQFIAEMGEPRHRPQLHLSVKTGFITCFAVIGLALLSDRLGVLAFHRAFLVPIFIKLATNTLAWAAGQAPTATVPAGAESSWRRPSTCRPTPSS